MHHLKSIVTLALILSGIAIIVGLPGPSSATVSSESVEPVFLPLVAKSYDYSLTTPILGVQIYGSSTPHVPDMLDAGTSWVRTMISWSSVQPTPDTFNWGGTDATITAAALENQLHLIVTITSAPSWAAEYPNGPIYEDQLDAFAEFVYRLVERYNGNGVNDAPGSPVVTYWEFYNEPDANNGNEVPHHAYWGNYGDKYAEMLSVVYPAVKAANPHAKVVFGGIAYDWFVDQGGQFVREFLDDVLDAGGGDYFDIMNFHSYPAFSHYWANQGPGLYEKAQHIREKLQERGLDKPLINTEAGWHSDIDDPHHPSTPEIQARYVTQLIAQSMAADLDIMIWWMLYDPGSFYPNYGLVTREGERKPAFYAFQTAAAQFNTAHFERLLTVEEMGGATDMQAYKFIDYVYNRRMYVAWTNPINASNERPLQLTASQATVKDIYGNAHIVYDGDDGVIDGRVTITITNDPVYIEINR